VSRRDCNTVILDNLQIDSTCRQSLTRYAGAPFAQGSLMEYGAMRQLPLLGGAKWDYRSYTYWTGIVRVRE